MRDASPPRNRSPAATRLAQQVDATPRSAHIGVYFLTGKGWSPHVGDLIISITFGQSLNAIAIYLSAKQELRFRAEPAGLRLIAITLSASRAGRK